ncbi:FKBP-type peptidyl-prolyl cis-trans isomerase [Coccomyxa subellipsoidea C-169]|uniref:peptidylprolyl isomerase n=1 Tax=Coccomyxa subellipsoidea (strain C-169) TaxID=574566 RepID=I0Z375_COCSC|nr:FKBP-type peptidyl-prolyl cis-trans isomerase [Coccomyxa subellipsoidea C-169]EIE25094.1 FKBP-type peptidyl-prolyl cis-trans isomerase [Coccomyxa subellipsoidea C-169]|eukprot:XP_005649638.1 FKBP-type peptidyl-prolyl cis-trans isomerase [Coccomyxa subellipsoidea C-169]
MIGRANAAEPKGVVDGGVTILVPTSTADSLSPVEKKALSNNRRIQAQNNVPADFPAFVRQGYDIKIMADDYTIDDKGLIYKDFEAGSGAQPVDGEEVTFDYVAYNENGSRIDSSYNKGRPASTRLGINGLIPGFEMGIKSMQVGGRRRIVVSPELGPPVGPSTFFSAKQCEVFDVQLRAVRQCRRRQVAMFSDVVCE